MTNILQAVARVRAYIERRKKARGTDIEHIHGFDVGPEGGIELLLSDLELLTQTPEGWKLLKDTTMDERSWHEDFKLENGHYFNTCHVCLRTFAGHKRRVTCKACSLPT
jgi:hypothetical protein